MRFLQHRFARVYPVHFLFIIAFVPLELAKWYVVYRHPDAAAATPPFAGDFELSALFSEIFLVNSMGLEDGAKWNQPNWSIGAEWYTYMLFPFFIGAFHRMGLRPLLYISICMLAVVFYISILDPESQLNRHYDYGFLRCLAEFCLGVVIYRLYTMRIAALVDVFSRDVTFIVIAAYIAIVMHLGMHPMLIVPAMALLVLAAATNTGLSQRYLNVRPLVYLGDISYSVYMSHWFVITLVGRVIKIAISPEFMASLTSTQVAGLMAGVIVAVLGVTIAISSLVYKYFEVPARYWVRSLRWTGREGKTA